MSARERATPRGETVILCPGGLEHAGGIGRRSERSIAG